MCVRPSTILLGNLQTVNTVTHKTVQKNVLVTQRSCTLEASTKGRGWQACCAAPGTRQMCGRQTEVRYDLLAKHALHMSRKEKVV